MVSIQLGFLAVLIYCTLSVIRWRKRKSTKRRLNCKSVRPAAGWGYLGLKGIKSVLAASRAGILPQHQAKIIYNAGKNAHTVSVDFLGIHRLATRDPVNIQTILSSKVSHWELGPHRSDLLAGYIGWNVFTNEGRAWKTSRALVRPAFHTSRISNTNLFEKHFQELIQKIGRGTWIEGGEGWSRQVDLQECFVCLTNDTSSELFFGYSIHSQNPDSCPELPSVKGLPMPNIYRINQYHEEIAVWLSTVAPLGPWHSLILPNPKYRRARREVRRCTHWLVQSAIQARKNAVKSSQVDEKGVDRASNMLDEMMTHTQDPEVLESEASGLFHGGRSTTGLLMAWTIFYLARQPEKYQKLRNAIKDQIGLDTDSPISDVGTVRECAYLQHCLREGLRLGNPVPSSIRRAAQDTVLPNGGGEDGLAPIFVPKGTSVVLNFLALHYRADLFGDDVEDFVPERWEGREVDWTLTPFGGGPRVCIGRK